MIARPVSGSHICLRCQLRLGRRSVPLHSTSQVAFQSTWRRKDAPDPVDGDTAEQYKIKNSGVHRPLLDSSLNYKISNSGVHRPLLDPAIQSRSTLSTNPLGRLYGFHGRMLREKRENLNVDTLGKPAQVIILRDLPRQYEPKSEDEPLQWPEPVDIMGRLDTERGLVGEDEVAENISFFRPKEGEEPRSWDEFHEIVMKLSNAFTIPQLTRYMESFKGRRVVDSNKRKASLQRRDGPPILDKSPWMPGISESIHEFDTSSDRGYYSPKVFTSKQRLVLSILRDCWFVGIPEVEDGLGEVELHLRHADLDLLLNGSKSPLRLISQNLVDEGEKIEAFRSRGVIRITTTRTRAGTFIPEIEEALQNIRRLKVDLRDLMPMPRKAGDYHKSLREGLPSDFGVDDSTINAVSHLTKTDIVRLSKHMLVISCIETQPEVSNNAHIARRLLLASADRSGRWKKKLACRLPKNSSSGHFLHYEPTSGRLWWRDRLRKWTRWTSAVFKDAGSDDAGSDDQKMASTIHVSESDSKDHTKPEGEILFSVPLEPQQDAIENNSEVLSAANNSGTPYWAEQYGTSSSVLVGSVLHNAAYPKPKNVKPMDHALNTQNVHTFCTDIPKLSVVLGSSARLSKTPSKSLSMIFQPSPWVPTNYDGHALGSKALRAFPPIEVRFSIDPKAKTLELKEIHATVEKNTFDLMLPHEEVDLRFQQETTSQLMYLNQLKPIHDFLDKSNLDLNLISQFATPPSLTLPIAKHLCPRSMLEVMGCSDTINVEYLFTGLEFRDTVAMDYKGWILLYTSIEGGRAGGKRGELKLVPNRSRNHIKRKNVTDEREHEAFIRAAYQLAEALGSGCSDGVVNRTLSGGHAPPARYQSYPGYFVKKINFSSSENFEENEEEMEKNVEERREGQEGQQNEKQVEDQNAR